MKRSLIILPGILVAVFLILSWVDNSEYAVEKRLFRIQRQFVDIAQDPKSVPENQFDAVAAKYKKIIRQYPRSSLIPQIYLQLGQVYSLKGDYTQARENYTEVLKKFSQNLAVCSQALLGIGASYEKENNEAQAVATYRQIIKQYPLTDVGLNMPVYIANYYFRLNRNIEAAQALVSAEMFYKKIAEDNQGTPARFNALRMLATTYLAEEKWDSAVTTFEQILFEYAKSPYLNWKRAQLILGAINTVSVQKMKNPDRPIAIYQSFIEKFPGHPLDKFLMEMIKGLKDLKSGKIKPAVATP